MVDVEPSTPFDLAAAAMMENIVSPDIAVFDLASTVDDPCEAMNELLALCVERITFNSVIAAADENPEGMASRLMEASLGGTPKY